MKEHPITETATEARQAVKVWPMKYVLGVGTIGAVAGTFAGLAAAAISRTPRGRR